ncbi:hypothetical protein ACOSP7_002268 [Xanthoceras sorbifolium]|uniref:X8 domain-containing protein n=1 Tax=Xanthoceras sorbifolium TaxID=99658 RepID=A0ABQ8IKP5_9ROSI|nr:hypothetical protein JRO89_XS01G0191500 [Xanthoceras sorbifolium]
MSLSVNFAFFSSFLSLIFHALFLVVKAKNGGGVAVSTQLWCVAKNNAEDKPLQEALDWACGAGGADCRPIQQGGPCYDPTDIQRMASYAFNDYFLKHGVTDDSCNFDNTAAVTSLNPSYGRCKFPASASVSNGSFSGSTTAAAMGSDSADFSGCDKISGTWFWPLIPIPLLFVITSKLGY